MFRVWKKTDDSPSMGIFHDRTMFSHINGKLSPRPFEVYGWTLSTSKNNRTAFLVALFPHPKQSLNSLKEVFHFYCVHFKKLALSDGHLHVWFLANLSKQYLYFSPPKTLQSHILTSAMFHLGICLQLDAFTTINSVFGHVYRAHGLRSMACQGGGKISGTTISHRGERMPRGRAVYKFQQRNIFNINVTTLHVCVLCLTFFDLCLILMF